jgi:hypothetical protein
MSHIHFQPLPHTIPGRYILICFHCQFRLDSLPECVLIVAIITVAAAVIAADVGFAIKRHLQYVSARYVRE